MLLIAGFTRKPVAPLLIGASLVAGVTWTFALARVFVGQVNIITGFLVAVLIGLGVDFGIHLYIRFHQETRAAGGATESAVVRFVAGTFVPALTSALTTAGTFFSFTIAEFRGFSEFGLIAGIGVLMTLASSFLILPPLLIVTRRARAVLKDGRGGDDRFVEGPSWIKPRIAAATVALFVIIGVLGALSVPSIPFRNDFRELRGQSEATQFFEYVNENLGNGFNPAVFLMASLEDASAVDALVAERASEPGSRISRSMSASDLLPRNVDSRAGALRRLAAVMQDGELERVVNESGDERALALLELGRQMCAAEPWTFDELPAQLKRRFVTVDGSEHLVYVWSQQRNDSDVQAVAWENELNQISAELDAHGIAHAMADETLIIAWIYRLIQKDGLRLLVVAAVIVFLLLLVDLRSGREALLVITPLLVGMLLFTGIMWLWSLELNMFNVIVVPSIIGIGIDNCVHIYHRYKDEGRGSIVFVLRRTGVAALLASTTTAVGFGSSLVSRHVGLQTLGILAIIGIASTFVAATVFFPALITLVEGRRRDTSVE